MISALYVLTVFLSGRILLASTDCPPPPSLSLSPSHPVYVRGESVTLTCTAPENYEAVSFNISQETFLGNCEKQNSEEENSKEESTSGKKKPKNEKSTKKAMSGSSSTLPLSKLEKDMAGSYTCVYYTKPSRRRSGESNAVSVKVTDEPLAPTLSLDPSSLVYFRMESIGLTCVVPGGKAARGFWFLRTRPTAAEDGRGAGGRSAGDTDIIVEIPLREGTSQSSCTHRFPIADVTDSRNYSCAYWVETSGRRLNSSRSSSVSVLVADFPAAPSLSVSPQHPVYVRGESLRMTCSAPEGHRALNFKFYNRGEDANPAEVATQISNSHVFPASELGYYSCAYEAEISGREILSRQSNPVPVSVRDPLCAPTFSLQPLSGTEEGVLHLTCTAPEAYGNLTVHFTEGSKILHSESGNSSRTSLSIHYTPSPGSISSPGNYSCYYEVEVQGRPLRSPGGNTILSTSEGSGCGACLHYIIGGSLGFVLTLLLFFLLYRFLASRQGRIFSLSSSCAEDLKDVTNNLATSAMTSNGNSHGEVKVQHLYCEIGPLQSAPPLYFTVNAPLPAPALYSTVNAPIQPIPALYSTVNAPIQPIPALYSTVNAPQSTPALYSMGSSPQPALC
ncbi:uncharacterized protein LOC115078805 [Rhinatrema bivittatum]|uniref:uncharacterized protein LOC115078805 n=1 Tax=Rhinatrema bivittatum TaxID=194408 RepID=UPI001128CFE8|nr:uncharacterized protein LOC115078805 [Rhinatrema bivittatum]